MPNDSGTPAEASEVEAPEVMKRQLRAALREARDAAGLTQREAADALEWSVSTIIRIERRATITPVNLRALLGVYGVTDKDRVEELVKLARGAKKKPWAEYKQAYSDAALSLFGSEAAAKTIHKYEPTFVPGLLQTQEYARALFTAFGHSEKTVELKVNARLERQELLDSETRPDLRFILGEAAVSRAVGGRDVMMDQLERIKKLGQRPGISLQVLPLSAGAHPHMGGAFTLLRFSDDDLLYLEEASGDRTIHDEDETIDDYYETFAILEGMATKPDAIGDVIDKIVAVRFSDTADPLVAG